MKPIFIRLAILFVLVFVGWCLMNSIIRKTLIYAWQSKTGLQLRIGHVQSSFDPAVVTFQNLEIARPDTPTQNLGTIQSITVTLDRRELLRRRFHATSTNIRGLQLNFDENNTIRDNMAGTWDQLQEKMSDWKNAIETLPLQEILSNNLDEAAKQYAKQFAISHVATELNDRWADEANLLRTQGNTLKEHFTRIRQFVDSAKQSPDKLQMVIGVLQELNAMDLEFGQLQNRMGNIESQLRNDRQKINEAIQKDTQTIQAFRGNIPTPKFDSDLLSEYILGEEMRDRLNGLLTWLDWGTSHIPVENQTWMDQLACFSVGRIPGESVLFPNMKEQSEVHLRDITLDGLFQLPETPIFFAGGMRNLSNQPKRMDQPMVLRFCISGRQLRENVADETVTLLEKTVPEQLIALEKQWMQSIAKRTETVISPPAGAAIDFFQIPENAKALGKTQKFEIPTLYVTAVLDRRGEVPRDHFFVHSPEYRLPERLLGDPQQLAFNISPGVSQFFAELQMEGNKLNGRVALTQTPVRIQTILPQGVRGRPIERILNQVAEGLQTITAELSLSGTRNAPAYAFQSNLGDLLAVQVEPILMQEWGIVHQKAMTLLDQQTQNATANIETFIAQKFQPILDDIAKTRADLDGTMDQSGILLGPLLQANFDRLSPKDQQTAQAVLKNPLFQSLLQNNHSQTGETGTGQLEQQLQQQLGSVIDKKAGELINKNVTPEVQNSIRSILGGLKNPNSQPPQEPRTIPVYP